MAPRKQVSRGATSKSKTIEATEGTVPPPFGDQSHTTKGTCFSSRQELIARRPIITAARRLTVSDALLDERADEGASCIIRQRVGKDGS